MKIFKKILLISFLLFLSSCQTDKTYILVEPGQVELNKIYSVNTNKKWSQFQEDAYNFLFWTIDGYTLQRIVFFKPIEEGRSLFDHDSFFTQENKKRPTFNLKMNKFEIKDFFENCIIWSREFSSFKTTNLKNYKLNDQDAISFDIEAQNELGLNYKGFVIAGIKEKKLITMYFVAAEMEYFNKYKKEAKKILSSIKFL